MGLEAHAYKLDHATDETNDEKNAQAPDAVQHIPNLNCEGGHALLKPLIFVGGGNNHTFSVPAAAAATRYVQSAAVENYKTNRNLELPQHNALIMSGHPEDSMGGDLVEYPVVFPSSNPTRYGNRNEVALAKL